LDVLLDKYKETNPLIKKIAEEDFADRRGSGEPVLTESQKLFKDLVERKLNQNNQTVEEKPTSVINNMPFDLLSITF
jgi:hypothetical protein